MGNHVHGTSITMEGREKRFWETTVSATNMFEYKYLFAFQYFLVRVQPFKKETKYYSF